MPISTITISNVDMYADDSTISACGKHVKDIELKLNNDLQEIYNWCDENRMAISVEKKLRSWSSRPGKNGKTSTKRTLASREINSKWSKLRGYVVLLLIISSRWRPIYKLYTTRLPENSHVCTGKKDTFNTVQGKPSTAATFYPIWTTASHYRAMQQYQIASINSNDVLRGK